LNEFGQIAFHEWHNLLLRFRNIELDEFVVMPNHVHGIIIINGLGDGHPQGVPVRAGFTPAQGCAPAPNDAGFVGVGLAPTPELASTPGFAPAPDHSPKLGDIIGAYKSLVANECLKIYKSHNQIMGKIWHRNYYEHIICNEREYENIANYIFNNPLNWTIDSENPSTS
jgi:REP element-mobilizing transposase RayT